ncbi:MAG TPA: short chain dehydrogenase [Myxococcaceae bacterium]|nr:short chain dehydrogenase [Myxococcaceae bacterium]
MRVLVIGGDGTIGQAIVRALSPRHEVIRASRSKSEVKVDITDVASIQRMYRSVGRLDAVVCAAGEGKFGPLAVLTDEDFRFTLSSKLMGQVNVVRYGIDHVNDRGSFTITTGILFEQPSPGSAAIAPVNGALIGFVRAAALELPRGIRINDCCPGWVSETLKAMGMDPKGGTPADVVARDYVASVEGSFTGRSLRNVGS